MGLAVAVRTILFLARGDFVGFDEGWYLLLARNLWGGEGYSLNGWPHTTFSPMFPALAGFLDLLPGINFLWAGWLVTILAGAAIVPPSYWLFRTLSGRTFVTRAGTLFSVLAPGLLTFVPFWSGRELYVGGSEPLMHLLIYAGITLLIVRRGWRSAALAGFVMGLAFYARPEAVALAALAAALLLVRERAQGVVTLRAVRQVAIYGLVVAGTMLPYMVYMRSVTGVWTLSGRGIELVQAGGGASSDERAGSQGRSRGLLWSQGNEWGFLSSNFTLDATGTRLNTNYLGVQTPPQAERPEGGWVPLPPPERMRAAMARDPGPSVSDALLYLRSMDRILNWPYWALVLLGIAAVMRERRRRVWAVLGVLFGTSVAIASLVHVDPRNHLFLVPFLCYLAAEGVGLAVRWAQGFEVGESRSLRFLGLGFVAGVMLLTSAERAYKGLVVESPFHVIGEQHRQAGTALDKAGVHEGAVMAWHPAVALFADRDWRALPYEPLPVVLRYAAHRDVRTVVLSMFNPSPLDMSEAGSPYIALVVPDVDTLTWEWALDWKLKVDNVSIAEMSTDS